MAARLVHTQQVGGSIPSSATIIHWSISCLKLLAEQSIIQTSLLVGHVIVDSTMEITSLSVRTASMNDVMAMKDSPLMILS